MYAKGDSAASSHYWREEDKHVLSQVEDILGPAVLLPNKQTINVTSQGMLPFSDDLTNNAKNAMILPQLKSASLISIGQLCDDDCEVHMNRTKLVAVKNDEIILEGTRNYADGLWDIPVHKKMLTSSNYNQPRIHPGMYHTKKVQNANIITTPWKRPR